MKTAICFTGTGRSLGHTRENIKKFLIDPHPDCDIFAHLSVSPDIDKIREYFDFNEIKNMVIEPDQHFSTEGMRWHPNWPAGLHSGPNPQQTYLNMLYSRKRCGEIMSHYCDTHDIRYEKVIFSRLDVEYYSVPDELEITQMCVPDFHNFTWLQGTGCNDRFAISNLKNMKIYFNLFDHIKQFIEAGGMLHAESFLGWHLSNAGILIKKYPIRFTRVRPDGMRQDERLKEPHLAPEDH
jgi:hypothetical protein